MLTTMSCISAIGAQSPKHFQSPNLVVIITQRLKPDIQYTACTNSDRRCWISGSTAAIGSSAKSSDLNYSTVLNYSC